MDGQNNNSGLDKTIYVPSSESDRQREGVCDHQMQLSFVTRIRETNDGKNAESAKPTTSKKRKFEESELEPTMSVEEFLRDSYNNLVNFKRHTPNYGELPEFEPKEPSKGKKNSAKKKGKKIKAGNHGDLQPQKATSAVAEDDMQKGVRV